jgi:hypothetical protein
MQASENRNPREIKDPGSHSLAHSGCSPFDPARPGYLTERAVSPLSDMGLAGKGALTVSAKLRGRVA